MRDSYQLARSPCGHLHLSFEDLVLSEQTDCSLISSCDLRGPLGSGSGRDSLATDGTGPKKDGREEWTAGQAGV